MYWDILYKYKLINENIIYSNTLKLNVTLTIAKLKIKQKKKKTTCHIVRKNLIQITDLTVTSSSINHFHANKTQIELKFWDKPVLKWYKFHQNWFWNTKQGGKRKKRHFVLCAWKWKNRHKFTRKFFYARVTNSV